MNKDQSTGGGPEREEPQAAIRPIGPSRKPLWSPNEFPPEPWEVALPESRFRFAPEYSANPETAVIVFDELWNAAGDDRRKQYLAFMKMLRWLLLELKETSKCGRLFLKVIPDYYREAPEDRTNLAKPYKKFHDLYLIRVCDWLPSSVRMSYRGYGKFGLGADAILDLVTELSDSAEHWAMSVPEIVQILDRLDQAAEILEEVLRDSIPTPTDKPNAGTVDGQRKNGGPELAESHSETGECEEQILETLRKVGHRLTTTKLLEKMEKLGLHPSESTVKKRLAEMMKGKRLTNERKAKPPGYGLPELGLGSSGS